MSSGNHPELFIVRTATPIEPSSNERLINFLLLSVASGSMFYRRQWGQSFSFEVLV